MAYHPAIGDTRAQLPRVAIIAALFAAAAALIGLHAQRATLPSEQWYEAARQQVMEGDLLYQLGDALERVGHGVPLPTDLRAQSLQERAVALWEQRTLVSKPNPAAAYRLGVIYGHRGYDEQAADMLTTAASRDEESSAYYHAIAELYSNRDLSASQIREQIAVVSMRPGWIAEIVLADAYRRLKDETALASLEALQQAHSVRFLTRFAVVAATGLLLFCAGAIALIVIIFRWGLRLPRHVARLPFMVPWTLLDVAEALAVVLFALVFAGLVTPEAFGLALHQHLGGLTEALAMAVQYLVVVGATIALIIYRVRARSSKPLQTLGLRFRHVGRLIATGLIGYGVFIAIMVLFAVIAGSLFGHAAFPAQTTEEIIGSAATAPEIAIYFVLVSILAPIAEETIFRGYIYGGLRRFLPARAAIVVGGALFAAVHLNGAAFLIIAVIGAMLCYLYERTRSLLPGIVAHGLHNGLVLAVMLLQSR